MNTRMSERSFLFTYNSGKHVPNLNLLLCYRITFDGELASGIRWWWWWWWDLYSSIVWVSLEVKVSKLVPSYKLHTRKLCILCCYACGDGWEAVRWLMWDKSSNVVSAQYSPLMGQERRQGPIQSTCMLASPTDLSCTDQFIHPVACTFQDGTYGSTHYWRIR